MAKDAKDASMASAAVPTSDHAPYALSMDKQLMDTLVFLALLFGIFYFLLIRPQQKRLKDHRTMLDTMKKGSRVITGGGVHGTVVKLEGDDVVHVEIAPNVRVKVAKATIGEVLEEGKSSAATANDN